MGQALSSTPQACKLLILRPQPSKKRSPRALTAGWHRGWHRPPRPVWWVTFREQTWVISRERRRCRDSTLPSVGLQAPFLLRSAPPSLAPDRCRTPEQVHLITEDVPLRQAYEDLLIPLRLTEERDSQIFTGLLLQVEAYLENHPDVTCTVYQMSKGQGRLRSVNDDQEIPTLFQGANYADAAHRDMIYPGDERERAAQGVTIQIHTLQIRQKDRGPLIADNVPTVAVWVPQSMAQEWLVHEQS
jgi:hypothetical protein